MLDQFQPRSRTKLLAILIVSLMAIFVVRLFYLQVIQHDRYVSLANQEQLKRLTIPASRGEIYMQDDGKLAKVVLNQTVYTMFVDPKIVNDKQKVIKTIRAVAGGNAVKDFSALLDKTDTRYQIVAKQVTRRQAELIKKQNLNGVGFQGVSQRVYPENSLAAQTLGFVNTEGKGQYGIESEFDTQLTGKDGLLQSVTDVSNVPLTVGNQNIDIPPTNGKNIALTIDRNIQSYTEQALADGLKRTGASKGSAIVLDPNTGKVMAMANLPTYNPAKYWTAKDASAFNNGVIATPYEPGSVIKTYTMATGIDTGTVTPTSTYNNTDYIQVADRTISNATKGQTGTITLQHALNWSLNTGMVTVAERLGGGSINDKARNIMYDYFHDKFGLGSATGIELAGEASGEVIPPTEVQGNAVRYATMAFGQGMNPTMVQVAAGFSSIVNGGTYYHPTVIEGSVSSDGSMKAAPQKPPRQHVIKSSTSEQVRDMVVKARRSFYATNDRKGYEIGGKTGTSQTLINGSYDNDQTVATYLGFGGDSKPRYVIMVQVSGSGKTFGGSTDAMPIFTDISNWMIDYLKLQPKG